MKKDAFKKLMKKIKSEDEAFEKTYYKLLAKYKVTEVIIKLRKTKEEE